MLFIYLLLDMLLNVYYVDILNFKISRQELGNFDQIRDNNSNG